MKKEVHPVKYRKAVILPKTKLCNQVKWLLEEKYPQLPVRLEANGVQGRANYPQSGNSRPRASQSKLIKQFKEDVRRLEAGEPLDYVIGFTEFLGCRIDLSKKPLIPRPETEYWVEKAIEEMSRDFQSFANHETRLLDMFAGSGCIGVSIMSRLQSNRGSPINSKSLSGRHLNIHMTFAEKDKNLLKQIEINCKINNIDKKRYNIIQSDIFSNVKGGFDYILANPPYIPTTTLFRQRLQKGKGKNKIQESVLKYEPHIALFGGENGMLYIRKFLAQAKNFLNPNGKIYMEFDSIQKKDIERLLKKLHYQDFAFFKDQYGKWRWVVIILNRPTA